MVIKHDQADFKVCRYNSVFSPTISIKGKNFFFTYFSPDGIAHHNEAYSYGKNLLIEEQILSRVDPC